MSTLALGLSYNGAALPRETKKRTSSISCRATTLDVERKKNLYRVLSLESETVGMDEIKKAYRSMALRCHPDVCPPSRKEESTRRFVELRKAYETLSDPALRRRYDNELRTNEMEGACRRVVQSELSRERWEAQLCELRMRSDRRRAREKAGFRWTP